MSEIVNAAHDDNQTRHFTGLGVIGTLGTADVKGSALTLPISVDPTTGAQYIKDVTSIVNFSYDNGTVSYTDGTTEAYIFKSGTISVGTITLTYLDTNKGSLSTFTRV